MTDSSNTGEERDPINQKKLQKVSNTHRGRENEIKKQRTGLSGASVIAGFPRIVTDEGKKEEPEFTQRNIQSSQIEKH